MSHSGSLGSSDYFQMVLLSHVWKNIKRQIREMIGVIPYSMYTFIIVTQDCFIKNIILYLYLPVYHESNLSALVLERNLFCRIVIRNQIKYSGLPIANSHGTYAFKSIVASLIGIQTEGKRLVKEGDEKYLVTNQRLSPHMLESSSSKWNLKILFSSPLCGNIIYL